MLQYISAILLAVSIILFWQARAKYLFSKLPPTFTFSITDVKRAPWEIYKEWSEQCGKPLIHLKLHRSEVIVVNKASVAQELLDHRWHNYSNRPKLYMQKLIGRENNVVVQQYGPHLKTARRLIQDTFSSRKSDNWAPAMNRESVKLISDLLSEPEDWKQSVQTYIGSFMVRLTYRQDLDPDYVRLVAKVGEEGGLAVIPGRWWVNSYPILRFYPSWAPGGSFQIWAKAARERFHDFTMKPFKRAKADLLQPSDSIPYSFVHKNLESTHANDARMESIVAGTAASLYSAAVDTTTSVIGTFLLMMIHNPHIQEKAASEIASVVGRGRLPVLEDTQNLPYVDALIKEVHRFHPAVPLLTRCASRDDAYENSFIPQDAWVLTNIWAMMHDNDEFHDPFKFNPERYLENLSQEDGHCLRDPRDFIFGIGRRRCPGVAIGNAAIFLAITRILATISIEPAIDKEANFPPPIKFTSTLISSPVGFSCRFKPRHNGVKELIKHAMLENQC